MDFEEKSKAAVKEIRDNFPKQNKSFK